MSYRHAKLVVLIFQGTITGTEWLVLVPLLD